MGVRTCGYVGVRSARVSVWARGRRHGRGAWARGRAGVCECGVCWCVGVGFLKYGFCFFFEAS